MKLAYLVNQYPKISHTFIRREIAAVERLGIEVERISIRKTKEILNDRADQVERELTHSVLGSPWVSLTLARHLVLHLSSMETGTRRKVGVRRRETL